MIVDTGVFVAASNGDEPYHDSCAALLQSAPGRLIVPALVIAEATYLIEQAKGPAAEAAFLRSLRSRRYQVEAPSEADLLRAAELVDQYADLPLGGTDASIVALAERLEEVEIAIGVTGEHDLRSNVGDLIEHSGEVDEGAAFGLDQFNGRSALLGR